MAEVLPYLPLSGKKPTLLTKFANNCVSAYVRGVDEVSNNAAFQIYFIKIKMQFWEISLEISKSCSVEQAKPSQAQGYKNMSDIKLLSEEQRIQALYSHNHFNVVEIIVKPRITHVYICVRTYECAWSVFF